MVLHEDPNRRAPEICPQISRDTMEMAPIPQGMAHHGKANGCSDSHPMSLARVQGAETHQQHNKEQEGATMGRAGDAADLVQEKACFSYVCFDVLLARS